VLLLWWRRVPAAAAAIAGLLLAATALTRTVALPVVLLVLAFLVVKLLIGQAGWQAPVAYTLAVVAPLVGYLLWFQATYDVYRFEQMGGRALYSRVMSIADCERLVLTPRQRLLCVPEPPSGRPEAADYWGWSPDSPARKYFGRPKDDPFLREFGVTVIRQQAGDYVRLVAEETSWHFRPKAPLSAPTLCRFGGWRFPERPSTPCNAAFYYPTPMVADRPEVVPQPSTPLRSALATYSSVSGAVRGPLLGIALLVVLAVAAWRPRRGGWRHSVDPLLVAATGFGLTFASVALGMYEPRYAAASIFLLPLAAVLALRRFARGAQCGGSAGPMPNSTKSLGTRRAGQSPAATG
jgi:hypothetical protein